MESADRKRGQRKGATSKNVKNRQKCQKCFGHFSTFFAQGKKVKNRQKVSNTFFDLILLTIFAWHQFSGPFWGALMERSSLPSREGNAKRGPRDRSLQLRGGLVSRHVACCWQDGICYAHIHREDVRVLHCSRHRAGDQGHTPAGGMCNLCALEVTRHATTLNPEAGLGLQR